MDELSPLHDLRLLFSALSDPTRRAILLRLKEGDTTVAELLEDSDLTQPTVSSHVRILERAGLLKRGQDGRTRPCQLDPQGLKKINKWLKQFDEFI